MTAAANPATARASPIRWMWALMSSSWREAPWPEFGVFAPNSSSRVRPVIRALAGICDTGDSSPNVSPFSWKPPSSRIAFSARAASTTEAPAATSSSAS